VLGQRELTYLLKRSATRRRAVLSVDENGLTVSVPWRTSEAFIARFLQDSAKWILRKLDGWEAVRPAERLWRAGESIDYLGRGLQLQLRSGPYLLVTLRDGDQLEVCLNDPAEPESVRDAVVQWYRRHALTHFRSRVMHYSAPLGVEPPRVFLSNARTRWGSCNVQREVRLNWRLMQAGPPVIDYVVAHELAHLKELNHSPRFWRLVEALCPQFRESQAILKAMTYHYMSL
jgi:predicted metal-dependent hydrolase